MLGNEVAIHITGGPNLPSRTVHTLTTLEDIEPLSLEVLEARRVGKSQQMANAKNQFAKAKSVGRMNIALHDLVVHQPIDDIGAFPIRRTEDHGMPQQVPLISKGVDAHALAFAEIFVRVVGVQGIDAHL